jgi:hypothetical protein
MPAQQMTEAEAFVELQRLRKERENRNAGKSWTVKFTVTRNWIEDGFELTNEIAREMIEAAVPFAYAHELDAEVLE